MSSYHDSFGNGPEVYDDDPEGLAAERNEEADERAEHPEKYDGKSCEGEGAKEPERSPQGHG
jgi:hypothetical protein